MNYTYADLKTILLSDSESIKIIESNEIEAVVSHWLHNQVQESPFVTTQIHKSFCSAISEELLVNTVQEPSDQLRLDLIFDVPFPPPTKSTFKFIDLFAGIGGFRIAMQSVGGKCVFSSEWDEKAKETYEANFGEVPFGDIKAIHETDVPDHDVLCAGFPCQPFSAAGVSARNSLNTLHGFNDEIQGTLFFDIARIVDEKKPKVVFLENVKNIVRHDKGRTFELIKKTFDELGYKFHYGLINSSSLVPQRRVRCYMVAVKENKDFSFPKFEGKDIPLKTILDQNVDDDFTISDKLWEGHKRRTKRNLARGVGFTAHTADLESPSNTIVARYGKDGKECLIPQENNNPRMLTPRECARLQGFPKEFLIPVAKTNAYKQFGNSVAVPVVKKISESIYNQLIREPVLK